jgi:hypothetical protein
MITAYVTLATRHERGIGGAKFKMLSSKYRNLNW